MRLQKFRKCRFVRGHLRRQPAAPHLAMECTKFCLYGLQRCASCTAQKCQGQDEQQQNRRQHPQKRDALRRFGRGVGLLPRGQGCITVCGILPCLCGIGGKLAVSGDVPPTLDNLGEDVTLLFEVDDDD